MGEIVFTNGSWLGKATYPGYVAYDVGVNISNGDITFIYKYMNNTGVLKIDKSTAGWTYHTKTIATDTRVVYYKTTAQTVYKDSKIVFLYYPNNKNPYLEIDWGPSPLSDTYTKIEKYSSSYLTRDLTHVSIVTGNLALKIIIIMVVVIVVIIFIAYIYNLKTSLNLSLK